MIKVTRSAVIDAPIERVWAVLRDFNSHTAWHPIVGESAIEGGEPADQVGCVRNFTLRDGNHIREQLLALSDEDHVSTYCILDATLPMQRYVATVQLKHVTDGNRTFWHWQSTFDVPRGREREFADLVGKGVYEAGFEGLRTYLRQRRAEAAPAPRRSARGAIRGSAIVIDRHGGADELKLRDIEAQPPGPGEARLRQTAIGVNYIDVYVRTGAYPLLSPPGVPGMEAAGEVIDVGEGVTGILPGDRVAYACPPVGAYAQYRTLKAEQLVVLPDGIGDDVAAALMLKGMSAEYLLTRVCRVQRGDFVLVHSAAGGVGLLLCQWAKHLGATVIGTVSTEAKARAARGAGCDHPIVTYAGRLRRTHSRDHRRPRRERGVRRGREGHARRLARGARNAGAPRELRTIVGQPGTAAAHGALGEVGDVLPPGAVPLHRRSGGAARDGWQRLRPRDARRPAGRDRPALPARRSGARAPRSRGAANDRGERSPALAGCRRPALQSTCA